MSLFQHFSMSTFHHLNMSSCRCVMLTSCRCVMITSCHHVSISACQHSSSHIGGIEIGTIIQNTGFNLNGTSNIHNGNFNFQNRDPMLLKQTGWLKWLTFLNVWFPIYFSGSLFSAFVVLTQFKIRAKNVNSVGTYIKQQRENFGRM